jgi:hypothetical protein
MGDLVLLRIFNLNKKKIEYWLKDGCSLYKIISILGQGTSESQKIYYNERVKIVNFVNIKIWNSPSPYTIEPLSMVQKEDLKMLINKMIHEQVPEF